MQKKASLLAFLNVLQSHTDASNTLTTNEIIQRMDQNYGIQIERKTVYNHKEILNNFGYEIEQEKTGKKGYYLKTRLLETSEVYALCHAVHSSHYISEKEAKKLIEKLLSSQSHYIRDEFNHQAYVKTDYKIQKPGLFDSINIILEAIRAKKQIGFTYLKYNLEKQLVPRRDKKYIVHPYAILYGNDKYYLFAKSSDHEDFIKYRIDKIQDIKIYEDRPLDVIDEDVDPYAHTKGHLYMYGGDIIHVELRCNMRILDYVIDTFGEKVFLYEDDDPQYFIAKFNASKQGATYFILQYLTYITILYPSELKDDVCKTLQDALDRMPKIDDNTQDENGDSL